MVRESIKTILGNEPVFPSNHFVKYKRKTDRILEKAILDEGLVRTYPFEWVSKYLVKNVNSDFEEIERDDESKQFLIKLVYGSKSIEPLKKIMNTFGYFCSAEENEDGLHLMQFEPKFEEYIKGSEFNNVAGEIVFYHVSPIKHKDKILNNGLSPRANNEYLKYHELVHLILSPEGKDAAYEMASMLYTASNDKRNDGTYVLFGITTDGLDNVKFYRDWDVEDIVAYFAYENIPPKNTKYLETFKEKKDI